MGIVCVIANTVARVVGPDTLPDSHIYDAGGQRSTRSRNLGQTGGFTTVYVGGLYEEDAPSGENSPRYALCTRQYGTARRLTTASRVLASRARSWASHYA